MKVELKQLFVNVQKAEASDEDEEGKALMDRTVPSSAKEEKDNESFFKKVNLL